MAERLCLCNHQQTLRLSVLLVVLKRWQRFRFEFFLSWAGVLVAENQRKGRDWEKSSFSKQLKKKKKLPGLDSRAQPELAFQGGWSSGASKEPALRTDRVWPRSPPRGWSPNSQGLLWLRGGSSSFSRLPRAASASRFNKDYIMEQVCRAAWESKPSQSAAG